MKKSSYFILLSLLELFYFIFLSLLIYLFSLLAKQKKGVISPLPTQLNYNWNKCWVDNDGFNYYGMSRYIYAPRRHLVNPKPRWTGIASWYSRKHCLGCSNDLRMANGKQLNDTKPTIAFNKLPLGTKVRVRNLENNMVTTATITDRGGFERYNRIADLTLAVKNKINCEGLCEVEILSL